MFFTLIDIRASGYGKRAINRTTMVRVSVAPSVGDAITNHRTKRYWGLVFCFLYCNSIVNKPYGYQQQ